MWDVLGSCVCEWRVGETCLVLLPGHHDGAVVDAHNVDLVDPSLLKPAVKLGSLEARDLVEGGGGGGSWTGSTSLGSMGRASIPTLNNSSKERHLGRGWEAEGANTNRRWKGRGGEDEADGEAFGVDPPHTKHHHSTQAHPPCTTPHPPPLFSLSYLARGSRRGECPWECDEEDLLVVAEHVADGLDRRGRVAAETLMVHHRRCRELVSYRDHRALLLSTAKRKAGHG